VDKLFLKDFRSNVFRGLKLIRALNFDPNTRVGPIRVEIAATSACNYRCWFCASHSYLKTDSIEPLFMSDEIIRNLFHDLRRLRVTELLFSGDGEPLLSRAMINEIKHSGKDFKIEILTNGGNLGEVDDELFRNLRFLTISLNSGNGNSHQVTHGYKGENQFPGIVSNIERLLNFSGANKKIKLNYVITADNYDELDDLIKMAAKWDVIFMARPVLADKQKFGHKTLDNQMLENLNKKATQYLAGRNLSGRLSLSLELLRRACRITHQESSVNNSLFPCYVSFIASYICSSGDVLICSSGQEKPLGNLNKDSYQSIWQKRPNMAQRILATQMHKTNKAAFKACRSCVNVQYHSLAFHNIYTKIPLLPGLLEKRGNKLGSLN
jgi:MoaA/NifB/PqqE/SkfB family radical SAM enzyme